MNLVLQEGSYVYIAPADRFPVRNDEIAVVKVNGDDATVKVVKVFDDVVIPSSRALRTPSTSGASSTRPTPTRPRLGSSGRPSGPTTR